jgi:ParB/RepB/Spo0J family partition protein
MTKDTVIKQVYSIKVEKVVVPPERLRKEFNQKKLRSLAESLKLHGQLQPGICRKTTNGQIILIAGERRLRACELAETNFLFVLENFSESQQLEIKLIELEENTCRVDLTWIEEVAALEELHQLKQQQFSTEHEGSLKTHSIRDTAEILGSSVGKIAEDLKLAVFSRVHDDVKRAKTKTEAKKIVKRLETTFAQQEKLKEIFAEEGESGESVSSEDPVERRLKYYNQFIHLGKMEEVLPSLEDLYDIVIFDPPWRVAIDTVRKISGDHDEFDDSKLSSEDFEKELLGWLKLLYSKMNLNSHLYMFFGIVNYPSVYKVVEQAGFTTNGLPLIWHKQGAHVTRNPQVWPGRCYEPIVFARKGSKAIVEVGRPDVLTTPAPTPAMKRNHPTAKHPDILIQLLKRSAFPGDKVLDPMAGSGMTGVACEVHAGLKLSFTLVEEKSVFKDLSLINVTRGYSEIVKEVEKPGSFVEIDPSSDEWTRYWTDHPEEQEAMTQFIITKGEGK